MKIIIDFMGSHIELTDGFAWCFIGLVAMCELLACIGIWAILESGGRL